MPRKSDGHKWEYHELAPAPGDEHPRPAQRCARCGLVRRVFGDGLYWYAISPTAWAVENAEPPCEPRATDTPQNAPPSPN